MRKSYMLVVFIVFLAILPNIQSPVVAQESETPNAPCNIIVSRDLYGNMTFEIHSDSEFDGVWGTDMNPRVQYWMESVPETWEAFDVRPDLKVEYHARWNKWEGEKTHDTWKQIVYSIITDYGINGVDYVDIGDGLVVSVDALQWEVENSEWQRVNMSANAMNFELARDQKSSDATITLNWVAGNIPALTQYAIMLIDYDTETYMHCNMQ